MTQVRKKQFEQLDTVNARVSQLIRLGAWTELEWNRAIDDVIEITGDSDSADWLIGEALERSWIDRRIHAHPVTPTQQKRSA